MRGTSSGGSYDGPLPAPLHRPPQSARARAVLTSGVAECPSHCVWGRAALRWPRSGTSSPCSGCCRRPLTRSRGSLTPGSTPRSTRPCAGSSRSAASPVDGIVGPATYRALDEARWQLGDRILHYTVTRPLAGDDVAELQHRLLDMGFDAGRVDGIFGTDTERRTAGVPAQRRASCQTAPAARPRSRRSTGCGAPSSVAAPERHARDRAASPGPARAGRQGRRHRPRSRRRPTAARAPHGLDEAELV